MVLWSSTIVFYFHSFMNSIMALIFTHLTMIPAIQKQTAKMHLLILGNLLFRHVFMGLHNSTTVYPEGRSATSMSIYTGWNRSRFTIALRGGVSIRALVRQAQLEQSCYEWAFQEPYDGNHQHLHFIPHCTKKVAENVLGDGHWLMEIG